MTYALRHEHLVDDFPAARAAVVEAIGRRNDSWVGYRGVDGGDVFLILGNPDKDGAPGYVVNKATGIVQRDREAQDTVNRVWHSQSRVVVSF